MTKKAMNSFVKKVISPQKTVGERLKRARKEKQIEIKEIADLIKINSKYLKALEEGRYESLPEDVYTRNFLKTYAHFLGLNVAEIMELYEKEWQISSHYLKEKKKRKVRRSFFPKISFRYLFLVIFLLFFFVISALFIKRTFSSPKLTIIYPPDNLIVKNRLIEISGRTEKDSYVKINNQEVFCDPNGYFKEKVVLQDGLNIIKIISAKKHSKEAVVLRKILVQ